MNSVKRLLWWLIASSKGGLNRRKILHLLRDMPLNTHQIAREMNVDYSTVQHHLGVLKKNGLITTTGEKYGAVFFLSPAMEEHWNDLLEIEKRIGKKNLNKKNNGDKDE